MQARRDLLAAVRPPKAGLPYQLVSTLPVRIRGFRIDRCAVAGGVQGHECRARPHPASTVEVIAMDLTTLVTACSLTIDPKITHALIWHQSGGEP
jgi:hypothetical protein